MKESTLGMWMQAITAKDGSKRRAFCLTCLSQGKAWIGGDLCEHFQQKEPVAPASQLDPPQMPQ
jgi:hypothetical protein